MAPLVFIAVLLAGALDADPAFTQAQQLYRSGDPVAAEVALGPLLDGSQPPAERARILLWAAMCADMSGRTQVAEDRAAAAVMLDPDVKLPAEMSLRLAQLVQGVRASVNASAAPASSSPTQPLPAEPAPAEAVPSAPPVPAPGPSAAAAPQGAASSSTTPAAAPSTGTADGQAAAVPAGTADAQAARGDVPPPPPEEEPTVTITTSLWAVAGGALTITMLLGAGAFVFGAYSAFVYYETLADGATEIATKQQAALEGLRFAGILGAAAAVAGVAAGSAAGVAWWLEQE